MKSRSSPQGRSASRTLDCGTLHVVWLKPGQPNPPGYKSKSAASCTPKRPKVEYVSPALQRTAEQERKRLKRKRQRHNKAARLAAAKRAGA